MNLLDSMSVSDSMRRASASRFLVCDRQIQHELDPPDAGTGHLVNLLLGHRLMIACPLAWNHHCLPQLLGFCVDLSQWLETRCVIKT